MTNTHSGASNILSIVSCICWKTSLPTRFASVEHITVGLPTELVVSFAMLASLAHAGVLLAFEAYVNEPRLFLRIRSINIWPGFFAMRTWGVLTVSTSLVEMSLSRFPVKVCLAEKPQAPLAKASGLSARRA